MKISALDQSIQILQEHKKAWATLPISQKADLLLETRKRVGRFSTKWVSASVQSKHIDPQSPWVGEEWLSGPWALTYSLNGFLESLGALSEGRLPKVQKIKNRPDGQLVAQVFPANFFDRVLLNGITSEVWMQPDVTAANLTEHMAAFYKQKNPDGKVVLILGAGNISAIAPLDALYRLYVPGHVVILKMSPVNEYLGPILEEVFAPYIQAGFLRIVYGGADIGAYLANHDDIEEIHLTGSAQTYDTIVFGTGPEALERKRSNKPLLNKPITSELGAACPTIVVPGKWSKADIRFQAEHIVTMKLHNSGFNCVASQVLVLPESWKQSEELLDAIRELMRKLPPRAAYYPGSGERQRIAVSSHPEAELFRGDVPRTLIVGIDPNAEHEYCFETEIFGPVFSQTSIAGKNTTEYLRNAVQFCNDRLVGTLGANIIIHPATMRELGCALEDAIADLHYGAVGVNVWCAVAYLAAQATWGAYPGHTPANIGSGTGVVRNCLMFDKPQRTVSYGSFYPFPRSWLHGDFSILPKPPWFVTNKTAHITARRIAQFTVNPGFRHLPGIFLPALIG